MTYRERREARAARRLEWAESRRRKAEAANDRGHAIADAIPFGQPILVGHHSEAHARRDQARIGSAMRQTYEHTQMAEHHERAAATIEAQLERSIYDDDPDAVERLRERIADLEAVRDQAKAANAAYRKIVRGKDDAAQETALREAVAAGTLSAAAFKQAEETRRIWRAHDWDYPPYSLTNLTANIARNRERLARLQGVTRGPSPRSAAGQLLAYEAQRT